MSKSRVKDQLSKALRVEVQGAPTPEATLGKVLFARRTAESITQVLNNVSDYVISYNTNLNNVAEEDAEKVNTTLTLLNNLSLELSTRISQITF